MIKKIKIIIIIIKRGKFRSISMGSMNENLSIYHSAKKNGNKYSI